MTTSVQGRKLRSKNSLTEARYGLSMHLLACVAYIRSLCAFGKRKALPSPDVKPARELQTTCIAEQQGHP